MYLFGTGMLFRGVSVYLVLAALRITCSGIKRLSPELTWWQRDVVYRVYPYTFQDSNNDGIGDLRGIASRIVHFQYLGVKILWLGPIFPSPRSQFGYGASSFTDVDPQLGTLKDFHYLMEELHKRSMKVILDVPLGHTSTHSAWFQKSVAMEEFYEDLYIWKDGVLSEDGKIVPPNNWNNHYGDPAWDWNDARQQYYLHYNTKDQPSLNYNSFALKKWMADMFVVWLEREVDGFCVSGLHNILQLHSSSSELERNNPADMYANYWPDFHQVIGQWRTKLDFYGDKTGVQPFLMINNSVPSLADAMDYYHAGADMVLNRQLLHIDQSCGGQCVYELVSEWLEAVPTGKWTNFALSGTDISHIASRKGLGYVNAMNMMVLTLPGMTVTYQGEELGLQDITIDYDSYDPWGRDVHKDLYKQHSTEMYTSPMQWTDEKNAGFTFSHQPWLAVHPSYKSRNVQKQKEDPSGHSNLQLYRQASQLRRHPSFRNTNIQYVVVNKNIFSYIRHTGNITDPGFLVILNLGFVTTTSDYHEPIKESFYSKGEVVLTTGQLQNEALQVGQLVKLNGIKLKPGEGLIIRVNCSKEKEKIEL